MICLKTSITLKQVSDFEHESEIENFLSDQISKLMNLAKSKFDIDNFETSLFSRSQNEQLETPVLETIRVILLGKSAKQLAAHLTKIDGDILLTNDKNGGYTSNLDFIFLSGGQIIRKHLIERYIILEFKKKCRLLQGYF